MAYTFNSGLTNNDSLEALLTPEAERERDNTSGSVLQQTWRARPLGLIIHALLLTVASTFFVLWIRAIQTACPLDPLLTYSPANEAVRYVEKQFDGRLNSTSIFRGDPSPGIDAAWTGISTDAKVTRLTREQFLVIGGNDTTAAVKFQAEDGGGYMAQIDCYHHIHCLDMLRKYLRRDYYASFDSSFNRVLRPHLSHCVDMLRQKLMCTVDLTMVNYDWVPGLEDPRPNLSAKHQCVDYERILAWSAEHNAHVLKSHVFPFGDVTELPEEALFGTSQM